MFLKVIKDLAHNAVYWYGTGVQAWVNSLWPGSHYSITWGVGDTIELVKASKAAIGITISMPPEVLSWWGVMDTSEILYVKGAQSLIPISKEYYNELISDGYITPLSNPNSKKSIPFYQDQEVKNLDLFNKPKYDSVCPHCGGPAFQLLLTVECPNNCHLKGINYEN